MLTYFKIAKLAKHAQKVEIEYSSANARPLRDQSLPFGDFSTYVEIDHNFKFAIRAGNQTNRVIEKLLKLGFKQAAIQQGPHGYYNHWLGLGDDREYTEKAIYEKA